MRQSIRATDLGRCAYKMKRGTRLDLANMQVVDERSEISRYLRLLPFTTNVSECPEESNQDLKKARDSSKNGERSSKNG